MTPKSVEALGRRHLMLFGGRASRELAQEVAQHLGIECGSVDIRDFANGETYARFGESVRGTDAFVIQTHAFPVNERIMEQLVMIDALKRASAKRISAVMPYYGYSRQDKKGRSREPITAKLVADMFKVAGADRLITVDLHSGQVQGFFDGPVDHLTARPLLADHIRAHHERDLVVVAPDAGRVKTAEKMAGVLGCPLAFLHKRRSRDEAE
ncbi:MAG TPA: ribose-phosphate diphosphokinase, partial [Actinomycetes bacterium]|nr:ribose-phosphate diphosphokinase [Actinomycetes bacterium]